MITPSYIKFLNLCHRIFNNCRSHAQALQLSALHVAQPDNKEIAPENNYVEKSITRTSRNVGTECPLTSCVSCFKSCSNCVESCKFARVNTVAYCSSNPECGCSNTVALVKMKKSCCWMYSGAWKKKNLLELKQTN